MRTRTSTLEAVLVAAFVQGCSCGPEPTPPPPDDDAGVVDDDAGFVELVPTTNAQHQLMLQQLGFTTAVGERLGPDGQALPARWHPLKTRFASFFPRKEVYVAGGPVTTTGQAEQYFDDKAENYAPLPLERHPDQTWIQAQFKNGLAVDVDDDGIDELFIVFFAPGSGTLKYILLDPNDLATAVTGVIDPSASSTGLDWYAQPSLASGDLDGDGRPEVAIGFGKLYVVSGLHDTQLKVVIKSYLDANDVSVAIGSVDQDPANELVVTHTETVAGSIKGFYEIYDGTLDEPFESGELRLTDAANQDQRFAEAQVAIGDVDGDHLDDIVFHGRRVFPGGNHWHLFMMRYDPAPSSGEKHFGFRTFLHYTNATSDSTPRTLALVDLDGNGVKEMYGWGQVIELTSAGTGKMVHEGVPGWPRAVAGNVDADQRDDLLVATNGQLRVYGLDALDQWVLKSNLTGAAVTVDSPVLVVGNTDRDSAIVRYDGDYELLFSDPHLLTVMASPPWQNGVGQDVASTTATFGKTSSSGVVTQDSLGLSVGFSVGFEYESDLFQTGFSAKRTMEAAFDFYASQSKTIETSHAYTTAAGADKVVFTTVPFDVYYYTVVSSPRASEVGKVLTVNLPRKPQTAGTSIEFYNAHNGGGLDVDARILQHTPGNVWSYPTVDDRNRMLSTAEQATPGYQRLWNGPIQVDESGSNKLGLSTTQGSARGASMDFSVKYEFEAKTGGATVGGSVGFHYGHSYEVTTEEGAFYEGSVGAIPGDAFLSNAYCYGLMVYPQVLAGQRFVVMNWWTQKQCGL